MRNLMMAAGVAGLLGGFCGQAHAVVDEGGTILEASGKATIDRWYFTWYLPQNFSIGAGPTSLPHGAQLALNLYVNDGAPLDAADLIASGIPNGAGADIASLPLAAGNYVFAISDSPFPATDVGSFKTGVTLGTNFDYEWGIPGNPDASFCSRLAGQFDGTFEGDQTCAIPKLPVVPEPASLAVLAAGLVALALYGMFSEAQAKMAAWAVTRRRTSTG